MVGRMLVNVCARIEEQPYGAEVIYRKGRTMVSENKCPGCRRTVCDGCGIYRKLNTNKQVRIRFPKGFKVQPGEGLGISFDVGTTTLAGMLWDLEKGTLLEAETGANPQAVFGADVISRIQAAAGNREDLGKMQKLLVEKLDEMASEMMERLAGSGTLRRVTVAGNTAMSEILLGIPPLQLSKAPFLPDYENTVYLKGSALGFHFLGETDIMVLPPIGGYVGADALAVHGYVSMEEKEGRILSIDIGTNGEILLQCDGKRFACSTAAGPALEGGAVSQGMRAVRGAVDMVSLTGRFPMEDLTSRVIGGGAGRGICGSGLVDSLAWLYRTKDIDHTGYMRKAGEARESGVPGRIAGRIRQEDGGCKFLLTDSRDPVYLTAGDVRQLQLSVSAIRSGAETLLEKAGLKAKQLDRIYLAGAFGSYIGIESGLAIGLFPHVPKEKIYQAGNLAGIGAAMALLSGEALQYMEEERKRFTHVELAGEETFKELFLAHMNFPLNF